MRRKDCTLIDRNMNVMSDNFLSKYHQKKFSENKMRFYKKNKSVSLIYQYVFKKHLKYYRNNMIFLKKLIINNPIFSKIYLEPSYLYNNQFFAKKTEFDNFLNLNNLQGELLLKNKSSDLVGHNFCIYTYDFNNINIDIYNNDEYKNIFKLKKINECFLKTDLISKELNLFFNYNIFLLNTVEIYKILILLNVIRILNKKYI